MVLVSSGLFLFLGFFLSIVDVSRSLDNGEEIGSPNYTTLVWNVTYHSTKIQENRSSLMEGYYGFVKSFVDFIMPEALPHGILTLQENETIISHIQSCVWSYKRIVLFLLLLLIQIIFIIYGIIKILCFLIPCRATHSYAPRPSWKNRMLKKYGRCMRLGWIHSYFTTLLFMILLAHNSNKNINQGMKHVSVSLDNSFNDVETYIDTSTEQLAILLTKNLEEYLEFFVINAERTTELIITDLENSIVNISLFGIFDDIQDSFKLVQPVLSEIKSLSEEIISVSEELVEGLNSLGQHIPCITEKCINVIEDGKALVNGTIKELEKGIDIAENLTNSITGEVIGSLGQPEKELTNLTSKIGGEVIEDVKNLKNLTTNIVGKVIDDLGKSEKALSNITSSIGGDVIEGGKALANLTENIGGNVITDLGKTKEALNDLTSAITGDNSTGNVVTGVNKLENLTAHIGGNVIGEIGNVVGGIGDLASEVVGNGKEISKVGDGITGEIDNVGRDVESNIGGAVDSIFNSGATDVTNKPHIIPARKNEYSIIDSGKKDVENLVGGTVNEIGGTVDSILNFGNSEGKTIAPVRESEEEIPLGSFNDLKTDDAKNVVGGLGREADNTVNNLFDIGHKKSESTISGSHTESNVPAGGSNPSNSGKDELTNVVGGVASEVGGVVSNIFDFGNDKPKSVTSAPGTSKKDEPPSVVTSAKNEIEGAVNNIFSLGNNGGEDHTIKPKNTGGVEGPINNRIDLRNGGAEEVTDTSNREDKNKILDSKRSKVNGVIGDVVDEIGGASKKIIDDGVNFLGFRRKREIDMTLDTMIGDFRKISNTINEVEHFVNVDVNNLKNMSILLSPIVKEVGVIVRRVLNEVKEEIKQGTKSLDGVVDQIREEVDALKHDILAYLKVIFEIVQMLIDVFEPFRYYISDFITYFLLLTFITLIIGLTIRIVKENTITDYIMKGGLTSLHVAALIMACVSLVYVVVGVTSQKFLCETFQGPDDNGVLRVIDEEINPAKLGLYVDVNLRRIIHNCHEDKSLYEVADLQRVFNLKDIERKYLNISAIEKELEQMLDFPLNFSKILPFEEFQKVEETLFGSFKSIMDSPIISTIDELKDSLGALPGVGDILKTFTDKIMSFENNFNILKMENSKKATNGSFFDELENSALSVERELEKLESNVVGTIQKIALKLRHRIIKSLTMYVEDRLIFSIQHDLGRCKPLSLALNTTVNAACENITTPANGHWFSWFICVTISIIIFIYSGSINNVSKRYSPRKQSTHSKVYHIEEKEMDTVNKITDIGESSRNGL